MEKTKATIYDVARRLGVSTTTVNRVLNNKPNVSDKTRKAVMEVIQELHYRPSKTASSLSRSSVKINMILGHTIFDFDREIYQGAEAAYRELYDFNLRGEVIEIPYNEGSAEFCRVIEEQVKECDALAIIPQGDGVDVGMYLNEHFSDGSMRFCNGISNIPSSVPLFTVVCNGVVAGGMAAQLLDFMLQGRGKVAMFTNSKVASVHMATCEGFENYVKNSELEMCGIYEHLDKPLLAEQAAARLLRDHPDVDGIYIGTANSVPICRYLEQAGVADRIKIVASDLFDDLSKLMDRGIVDATIFQNPYMIGKQMIKTMYEIIAEGRELETKQFLLDPQIVMNSNKHLYIR